MEEENLENQPSVTTQNNISNPQSQLSSQIQILNQSILDLPKPLQTSISGLITNLQTLKSFVPLSQLFQIICSISDTVKKATQPQINSFNFDLGFNANPYPVFGIIAWKNQQLGYNLIDWRVCSFVESGGVRCVPILQCDLQDPKNIANLKSQIQNIHGLVIPEFYQQNSTVFLEKLSYILTQHQKDLVIYSFANSSAFILSKNYENIKKPTKPRLWLIEGKLIHTLQSDLFSEINIIQKLKILSEPVSYPVNSLPQINLTQFNKVEQLSVESYLVSFQKGSEIVPCVLKQKLSKNISMYHSFINMFDQSCVKGLQYFNKGIINLVNLTKEKLHSVKNPTKYIAHYPLQLKQSAQKAHYKIVQTQSTK